MKATQTIKSLVVASLFSLAACGVESPDGAVDPGDIDGQDELEVSEVSDGNDSPSLAPRMPRDPLAGDDITIADEAPARAQRLLPDAPATEPTTAGSKNHTRGPQGGVTVE